MLGYEEDSGLRPLFPRGRLADPPDGLLAGALPPSTPSSRLARRQLCPLIDGAVNILVIWSANSPTCFRLVRADKILSYSLTLLLRSQAVLFDN